MLHLIGTVFTYITHITLPALLTDSTSQTVLLFAGFSLVFLLTMFCSCQTTFSLEEKAFMAFPFLGEESTGNGVSGLGKEIYTIKRGGFSSAVPPKETFQF